MYSMRIYHSDGLAKIALAGQVPQEQLQVFGRDLEQTVLAGDRPIRGVLVDQTGAEPLDPEPTALLTAMLLQLLQRSSIKIALLVGSELVAHQLDRVAESLETDGRLRHFGETGPALAWLTGARPPVPGR